jgi:hypothetical protein
MMASFDTNDFMTYAVPEMDGRPVAIKISL